MSESSRPRGRDLGDGYYLRTADPDEYDAVGAALLAAFTHGCWITEEYRGRLGGITQWAESSHLWVIATGQGQIHAVVATPRPQQWEEERFTFNILGVAPSGRGRGFGQVLVDHCLAVAQSYGFEEVEIHSSPQMTHAHQLYYRCGFHRRIDWETRIVDSGQRLFTFTKKLTDKKRELSNA